MAVACFLVGGTALGLLYWLARVEVQNRLVEVAQGEARILEAMVRAGQTPENALAILHASHHQYQLLTKSGEIDVALRRGDEIVFLMAHRSDAHMSPPSIPWESDLAQPMRAALSGGSGVLIGRDYRGRRVLAAYEPVQGAGWGVVAKIDMAELYAPFLQSGTAGASVMLVVVLLAALIFVRMTNPLVQRLEESESRFRAIFNQTFEFVWLMKPDGTLLEANQTALDFTGQVPSLVRRRFFWETRWWNEPAELQELVKSAVAVAAQGQVVRREVELRGFGERAMTLDFSLKPVADSAGRIGLLIGEGRDITERKAAERTLAEHSARLDSLIRNSPLAIVAHDKDARVTLCNPAFEQLFQYRQEQIIGRPVDDLIASVEEAQEAVGLTNRVLTGESVHVVTRRRRRDGTAVDVELHTVPLQIAGESLGGFGLYQDITDRLQAENEVRARTTQLDALIRNSPLAIVVLDAEQRIQMCNPAFEQLFFYRQAEIMGAQLDALLAPPEEALNAEDITRRVSHGAKVKASGRRRRRDGTLVEVEIHAVPLVVEGKTVGAYALYDDITERRRHEVERERLVAELREALKNVKTLSGLLPICASCKKIRDDKGYWNRIETFLREHSQAEFSHGICPDCAKKLYPDQFAKMYPEKKRAPD